MIAVEKYINFGGSEWTALRMWLKEKQEQKIALLISSDNADVSNKLRGSIGFIRELLAVEDAASKAANKESYVGTDE